MNDPTRPAMKTSRADHTAPSRIFALIVLNISSEISGMAVFSSIMCLSSKIAKVELSHTRDKRRALDNIFHSRIKL